MNRPSQLYPAGIATTALLLGCSLYLYTRPDSVFYLGGNLSGLLTGQLPSFLHTLAFALAGSLLVQRQFAAIVSWGTVELVAEIAQHELASVPVVLMGYQQRSTFDPLDLLSILTAVIVAVLLTKMTRNSRNR